jgi:hypothetical protein
MKNIALAVIIALLLAIAGYLAIDRHEKNAIAESDKAFKERISKIPPKMK